MKTVLSAAIGAMLALSVMEAGAQAKAAERKVELAIEQQSLADALNEWAKQTGLQLVSSSSEMMNSTVALPIKGEYTPKGALEELLKGTSLTYEWVSERAVAIREKSLVLPAALGTTSVEGTEWSAIRVAKLSGDGVGSLRVVANDQQVAHSDKGSRNDSGAGDVEELEEIVVTGSRIERATKDGVQDVRVYSRKQIERSGQATLAGFINTLPSVSVAVQEQANVQNSFGSTTIQLRGLPVGTTLLLIDGHRVQTSGTQSAKNFFDLNNLPMAAVERIEVLAGGASAIYGSDAIAGVVNIILKKDFAGAELSTRYGTARDHRESNSSIAWGRQWERGRISIVGAYQYRDALLGSERFLTATNDYRRDGGPDNNFPACNPGNVFSIDGSNLPGLDAPYAAVPAVASGTPTLEDFVGTAGSLNTCALNSAVASIIPETHRTGVLLNAEYDLTSSVSLYSQVLYSHSQQHIVASPSLLFGTPDFQSFTVSESNPYNPFGTTVGIGYAFPGNLTTSDGDTDFLRPLVGLRGTLGNDWTWEVSALHSQDWTEGSTHNYWTNDTAIQEALNSSDPAAALNPFVAGSPGAVSQSFFNDGLTKFSGRGQVVSGLLRGALFNLPAGSVQLAIGADYQRDKLYSRVVSDFFLPPNTTAEYTRRSAALFAETRIPILTAADESDASPSRVGETLALTLAARHDDYSDFGSTTKPQFGVEWRPWHSLLVRGAYAEAFKAPSLYSLYSPLQISDGLIVDPATGIEALVPQSQGGNRTLDPEGGRSQSLGFVYSTQRDPNVRLSVTHWKLKQTNAIQSLDGQYIVNNEGSFPGRVVRSPTGEITLVDSTLANFGEIDVSGIDYQFDYEMQSALGQWSASISAAQIYRYDTQLIPGSPPVDRVSKAEVTGNWSPRWKGTVGLGLVRDDYSFSVHGRYVSQYQDYGSDREIGDFWLYDMHFRYELGQAFPPARSWLKGAYLEGGGVNLLDRRPEYSNFAFSFLGYDPAQADIRGRYLYLGAGFRW